MSAIERIQAAIDKLTALKAEPQPQYLVSYEYDWVQDGNNDDLVEYVFPAGVEYGRREERDRTIDAQLSILRDGLIVAKHWEDILEKLSGSVRIPITHALLFADAILGTDPH